MNLTVMSDTELLTSLKDLVTRERHAVADIVAHLAEVDERGLYLKYPAPSLTAYCMEALGYDEHPAFHRVTAARLVKRYPLILTLLREGQLNLSGIRTLAPVLSDDTYEARLRAACGKTRRQIEELVASWAPKPDVPTRVVAVAQKALPELLVRMEQDTPRGESLPPQRPAPLPKPIAPDRYTITVTVDRETRDALMRARDHLRHVIPDGDLAKVISRAVNCHIAEDGRRCSATAWLEYDHKVAWSLNGPTTTDNLQLLCKSHNRAKAPARPGASPR